jgi:predicted peroxiredoxin
MSKLLVNLTTAKDNPDKTVVAFVIANAALASEQEVVVFLNIEAVRLAIRGYADDITSEGFRPLKELLETYLENDGEIWVCPPCFTSRGLEKENMIPEATFAGGAPVVAFLAEDASCISY